MVPVIGEGPLRLCISAADLEHMRLDVAGRVPEEACGLLAGRLENDTAIVSEVIPTTNVLHSPVRYRIEPAEQLAAFEQIDSAGLELVGIYHSHPNGPAGPSATDLAEAYYPEAVYLIWSGAGSEWRCAAYRLQAGAFEPAPLQVLSPE